METLKNVFPDGEKGFKKDPPALFPANVFMFNLLISNHYLELIELVEAACAIPILTQNSSGSDD